MRELPKTQEHRQTPKPGTRRIRLAIGWTLIALGILGLFLPFLQGILFIAIGLLILAEYSKWASTVVAWVAHRYPKAGRTLDRSRGSVEKVALALESAVRSRWLRFGILIGLAATACYFWLR